MGSHSEVIPLSWGQRDEGNESSLGMNELQAPSLLDRSRAWPNRIRETEGSQTWKTSLCPAGLNSSKSRGIKADPRVSVRLAQGEASGCLTSRTFGPRSTAASTSRSM